MHRVRDGDAYWPSAHTVQADVVFGRTVPAPHSTHSARVTGCATVPAPHGVHAWPTDTAVGPHGAQVCFALSGAVPLAHRVQPKLPTALTVPSPQGTHVVLSALARVPAPQAAHTVAVAPRTAPSGHGSHSARVTAEGTVPLGQATQVVPLDTEVTGQRSHWALAASGWVPLVHGVQPTLPGLLTVPGGHARHSVASGDA